MDAFSGTMTMESKVLNYRVQTKTNFSGQNPGELNQFGSDLTFVAENYLVKMQSATTNSVEKSKGIWLKIENLPIVAKLRILKNLFRLLFKRFDGFVAGGIMAKYQGPHLGGLRNSGRLLCSAVLGLGR